MTTTKFLATQWGENIFRLSCVVFTMVHILSKNYTYEFE